MGTNISIRTSVLKIGRLGYAVDNHGIMRRDADNLG